MTDRFITRKATVRDATAIHSLINKFARKELMLPRSLNDIYENLRDFIVCTSKGKIIASSSLHILWEDLAEIKSVAVSKEWQKKGVGRKLITGCMKEAKSLGVKRVFALTYNPDFFIEQGFVEIDKNSFPQKIWGECLKCPKFPDCDELAVIKKV